MKYIFILLLSASISVFAQDQTFKLPSPHYVWSFPRDHGHHLNFKTEWWYYTGLLYDEGQVLFQDKARYGIQLTFFRQARDGQPSETNSGYLAHSALADFGNDTFTFSHQRGLGGLDIMGSAADRLNVWGGRWSAEAIAGEHILKFDTGEQKSKKIVRLRAKESQLVFHGENGFSRKGACESCSSLYYSLPVMPVVGEVYDGNSARKVHGVVWMDHEIMSNAMDAAVQGWDWLWLTAKSGRSYMLFRVRRDDGNFLSGTVIKDGKSFPLAAEKIILNNIGTWKSPRSGTEYPTAWEVAVDGEFLKTVVTPRISDQELFFNDTDSVSYWEGAVNSKDESLIGFLEMTGYQRRVGGF